MHTCAVEELDPVATVTKLAGEPECHGKSRHAADERFQRPEKAAVGHGRVHMTLEDFQQILPTSARQDRQISSNGTQSPFEACCQRSGALLQGNTAAPTLVHLGPTVLHHHPGA